MNIYRLKTKIKSLAKTVLTIFILLVMLTCVMKVQEILASNSLTTVKEIAEKHNTPLKISKYLFFNYKYIRDVNQFGENLSDYFQKPEEMIKNKKGDCEDYAILTKAILKELGIDSLLVCLYWKDDDGNHCHVICAFKEEGKYSYMDNQYYVKTSSDTIEGMLELNYSDWKFYEIITEDDKVLSTKFNLKLGEEL